MPVQRLTISLPEPVYQDLKELVPAGEISQFVAKRIEEAVQSLRIKKKKSAVEELWKLSESSPKYTVDEILEMIDRGRA